MSSEGDTLTAGVQRSDSKQAALGGAGEYTPLHAPRALAAPRARASGPARYFPHPHLPRPVVSAEMAGGDVFKVWRRDRGCWGADGGRRTGSGGAGGEEAGPGVWRGGVRRPCAPLRHTRGGRGGGGRQRRPRSAVWLCATWPPPSLCPARAQVGAYPGAEDAVAAAGGVACVLAGAGLDLSTALSRQQAAAALAPPPGPAAAAPEAAARDEGEEGGSAAAEVAQGEGPGPGEGSEGPRAAASAPLNVGRR